MRRVLVAAVTAAFVAIAAIPNIAIATHPPTPAVYKNCTNFNKRYPHGVGKNGARDGTGGTPVTTFRRSTTLYNLAMHFNRGLDRDKDGVVCEKR